MATWITTEKVCFRLCVCVCVGGEIDTERYTETTAKETQRKRKKQSRNGPHILPPESTPQVWDKELTATQRQHAGSPLRSTRIMNQKEKYMFSARRQGRPLNILPRLLPPRPSSASYTGDSLKMSLVMGSVLVLDTCANGVCSILLGDSTGLCVLSLCSVLHIQYTCSMAIYIHTVNV